MLRVGYEVQEAASRAQIADTLKPSRPLRKATTGHGTRTWRRAGRRACGLLEEEHESWWLHWLAPAAIAISGHYALQPPSSFRADGP